MATLKGLEPLASAVTGRPRARKGLRTKVFSRSHEQVPFVVPLNRVTNAIVFIKMTAKCKCLVFQL